MYGKHLLEIQQGGGSVEAHQLAPGVSVMEPAASAWVPRPNPPPFQQGCGDVGAQQLEGSGVGAFVPSRPAHSASTTEFGPSVLVPRPPPPPPPLPPRVSDEMAEVAGLIHTVLTELTVLKQEIKQAASDIQQLKDQVRVLTVAANDMVQPPHRSVLPVPPHPQFQR